MNLYVTPEDIKSAAPDLIRSTTTKYDDPLYRRCVGVSRAIDRRCKRQFYPFSGTFYFDVGPTPHGVGTALVRRDAAQLGVLWVPDLIEIDEVALSFDRGKTYTALDADGYYGAVSEDFNSRCSFNMILLDHLASYARFPAGRRTVRISGIWGYTDDREACWEDSGISLAEAMTAEATELVVEDATLTGTFGLGTALQLGRLIRIGEEMLFVRSVSLGGEEADDVVTVIRRRNGSEAVAHDAGTDIYLWRPPYDISQAAMISAVRDLARAQQGYVDTRGGMEIGGQMMWVGRWDPEAEEKMSRYIKTGVG